MPGQIGSMGRVVSLLTRGVVWWRECRLLAACLCNRRRCWSVYASWRCIAYVVFVPQIFPRTAAPICASTVFATRSDFRFSCCSFNLWRVSFLLVSFCFEIANRRHWHRLILLLAYRNRSIFSFVETVDGTNKSHDWLRVCRPLSLFVLTFSICCSYNSPPAAWIFCELESKVFAFSLLLNGGVFLYFSSQLLLATKRTRV